MMSAVVVPLIIATLAAGLAVSEYVAPGLVPVPKFLNASSSSSSSSAPRNSNNSNRPQSRPAMQPEEKKEPSWSQVRPAAAVAANANSRNAPAPLPSPPPLNNAAATRNSGRKNGGIEGLPNFEPVFR